MLHSIQQRYGEKLRATHGEIGHVRDFYFDDKNWAVRYLVADTGGWLSGRLVLIPSHSLGRLLPKGKGFLVNLSPQTIEKSPSIDEHKPVSRQYEDEYQRYYGYPYYAESWPLSALAGYPVMAPPPPVAYGTDSHLRSTRVVKGYKVEATDGVVGEVADFMIDGRWMIREIVVQSGHSSNATRLPTETVSRISYDESTVYVNLAKAAMGNVNGGDVAPTLASSNMGNLSV
jgi:hypothetical protein